MKVRIKGYGRVDYVSKKTGNPVKGWNIYICREPMVSEQSRVTGEICEDLYVSDAFDINKISIGFDYNVTYNRYGGVEEITECV